MGEEKKNRKRWIVVVALSRSFVTVLVFGEVLVRMFFPYITPDTLRKSSLQYLPSIFSKHRLKTRQKVLSRAPRFQFYFSSERGEPQSKYFINNIGYRGNDVDFPKPNDVIRIAIVGGSAVFDQNVIDDKNIIENKDWPHLVEAILNSQGNQRYEVINAGVPSHTSFDSLGRLYSQLWVYSPDYVVLYNGWNDIKYFHKLKPETPLITLFNPYNDKRDPFRNYLGTWDWLLSYSQLYIKLRNRYLALSIGADKEGVVEKGNSFSKYSPLAIAQYKLNVELFVDASRNIGAIPILLTQATPAVSNNSQEEKNLIGYHYVKLTHEALVNAYEDTYRVIREVEQGKKVATLDLAKNLNGRVELFSDHVHTTPRGSEEIAKAVSGFLLEQLETPSPS